MTGERVVHADVDAARLAELVAAMPQVPMVTAHDVVPGELGGIASGATIRRRLFGVNAQLVVGVPSR
jgi:hypothetical protein